MTRTETRGFLSTLCAYLPHYAPPTLTDELVERWYGSNLEFLDVHEIEDLIEVLAVRAHGHFPAPLDLDRIRSERREHHTRVSAVTTARAAIAQATGIPTTAQLSA